MSKNIVIVILVFIIGILVFYNSSNSSKVSKLEQKLSEKNDEITLIGEQLDEKERLLKIMKKEAEIWAARAYGSGYDHSN